MWTAQFRNGEVLKQFDANNKEVAFRKVLDRERDLKNFTVTFANITCNVSLTDGIFTLTKNNTPIEIYTFNSDKDRKTAKKAEYRLIYFQRCIERISVVGSQSGILFTAVGFQTNLVDGKNIKRILKIHTCGALEIECD